MNMSLNFFVRFKNNFTNVPLILKTISTVFIIIKNIPVKYTFLWKYKIVLDLQILPISTTINRKV